MSLSLQSRRVGDIIIVKCSGEIVGTAEAASLQEHVADLLPDDPNIVLDLGEVGFIDSSGLGFLVRILSRTHAARGDLKLCTVPPRIKEILRITRLKTIFATYESEAEAIAAFYQRAKSADAMDRFDTDILCVEKSPDVLAYISQVLRQAGYGVLTSGNLPDALMLLKASRPRALVIGADLRTLRDTWSADTFNELASTLPVVQLPRDFPRSDAGEAGRRLLDEVRALIGEREPNTPARRTKASGA